MIKTNFPRLHVLSRQQRELIHGSSLEVLRRTGVMVKEPQALEIFKKAGCRIEDECVRIPSNLVEWALRNVSPRVCLCDRNGDPAMFLEENNVYYGTGSDTPHIIDPFSGQRRLAKIEDVENVSKTVDYLEGISFVMCSGIASDVKAEISDLYHFEAMVKYTEKPIVFTAWNLENLKAIVKMAEVVSGNIGKLQNSPFLALYTEPISPLLLAKESTQKLMYMADQGLPVVFSPAVITGGTGPVTLAGGLIQGNAEVLAGCVLSNLVKEGAPFIYGGGVTSMDMASSIACYASPEFMLGTCAVTDMARYYQLPTFHFAGCSDSNTYDQQAALEGSMWVLLSQLSGGNLVHDVGYINSGLTMSFEQLVVTNEVIGLVRRIAHGIEINTETMALDLIDEVGPGGEYLTSDHTLKHFRENWFPDMMCRSPYEKWVKEGKLDLGQKANLKVRDILEHHTPRSLAEDVQQRLKEIIEANL